MAKGWKVEVEREESSRKSKKIKRSKRRGGRRKEEGKEKSTPVEIYLTLEEKGWAWLGWVPPTCSHIYCKDKAYM